MKTKKTYPVTINLNQDEVATILKASGNQIKYDTSDYTLVIDKLKRRVRKDWMGEVMPSLAEQEQLVVEMQQLRDKISKIVLDPRRQVEKLEIEKITRLQDELYRKFEKADEAFVQNFLDRNRITKFVAYGRSIITLDEAKKHADWEVEHLGCTDHNCWNTHKPTGCKPKTTVCLVTDYHNCDYFSKHDLRSFVQMFLELGKLEDRKEALAAIKVRVVHFSEFLGENWRISCGAKFSTGNGSTTDRKLVTCKRCLRIMPPVASFKEKVL